MDKYLRGEENSFKEHPKFIDYKYNYTTEGTWPKIEEVESIFTAPFSEQKTPESLKPKVY